MNLPFIIDQFVEKFPDYRNDVDNFADYLKTKFDIEKDHDSIIQGTQTQQILASLNYCIEYKNTKTKSTARKYCAAIKQLFLYIFELTKYENRSLEDDLRAPDKDPSSYTRQTLDKIRDDTRLAEERAIAAINEHRFNQLLGCCSAAFQASKDKNVDTIDKTSFNRMTAALSVELMLLLGIMYRVLRELKLEDLSIRHNALIVNGFTIRLPFALSDQFGEYLKHRLAIGKTKYLFCDHAGQQLSEKTIGSGIPSFLKTWIDQTDTTSLSKFGITELIKAGISDCAIRRLTGASERIVSNCIDEIEPKEWERDINARLLMTKCHAEMQKVNSTDEIALAAGLNRMPSLHITRQRQLPDATKPILI